MATEKFSNNASSTLNGNVDGVSNPVVVNAQSGHGARFPTTGDFRIVIDSEILLCTSRSTDALTCSRAQEGTTIAAHTTGTAFKHVLTAASIAAIPAYVPIASQLVVGKPDAGLSSALTHRRVDAYHTGAATWKQAVDNAFAAISAGGIFVPQDLGQMLLSGTVQIPGGKFLYGANALGAVITQDVGPISSSYFQADSGFSGTDLFQFIGNDSGLEGIMAFGGVSGSSPLVAKIVGVSGSASQCWVYDCVFGRASSYVIDFATIPRSSFRGGWLFEDIGFGGILFRGGIDCVFQGPVRMTGGTQCLEAAGGGGIYNGPIHATGRGTGAVLTTNIFLVSGSDIKMRGPFYTDTCEEAHLKVAAGGNRLSFSGLRARNSSSILGTQGTKPLILLDSTGGGVANGIFHDIQADKGSRTYGWSYVVGVVVGGGTNTGHVIDMVQCPDIGPNGGPNRLGRVGLTDDPTRVIGGRLGFISGTSIDTTVALTDAATVAVDLGSTYQLFSAALTANRTIGAPTNAVDGHVYTFAIQNSSGGAMTTTWNAAYKLAGAWTDPANGKIRTITFYCAGANLIEISRAAADI